MVRLAPGHLVSQGIESGEISSKTTGAPRLSVLQCNPDKALFWKNHSW